jgi:DNA-binding Xre family transcriptional regulator
VSGTSGIRYPGHKAHPPVPPLADKWLDEGVDLVYGLRVWAIYHMMFNRSISRSQLADELGLSRQRAQQLLTDENYFDRVEAGITAITKKRHDEICDCDDPSCAVYIASGKSKLTANRMAEGKKEWLRDG